MDDRLEREAALSTLSSLDEEILRLCVESVEMLDAFQELNIISQDDKDDANENEDYGDALKKLREKVVADPSFIVVFCSHIKQVEELSDLAKRLSEVYSEATLSGQSAVTSDGDACPEDKSKQCDDSGPSDAESGVEESGTSKADLIKSLRKSLILTQELHYESEKEKEGIQEMKRNAITTFITASLDMGVQASVIHETLEYLLTKDKDIIINNCDIYKWCKAEVDKQSELRNPDSLSLQRISSQPLHELSFSKVVVQNSIFACHLLERSDTDVVHLACLHSLFEVNKTKPLRIDTKSRQIFQHRDEIQTPEVLSTDLCSHPDIVSACKLPKSTEMFELNSPNSKGTVHQYLIAKGETEPEGHVIYYVAFSSHQSLREWNDNHTSFESGFKKQQEQLPVQFIVEKLWEGASVVLTGFSFGGVLAQLCGTYLWSLQGICHELLERNLLCVTFGQPIFSLPRSTNFADRVAEKSRFHTIYIPGDRIPMLLSCLDPIHAKCVETSDMPKESEKPGKPNNQKEILQSQSTLLEQLMTLQDCKEHEHNKKGVKQSLPEPLRQLKQRISNSRPSYVSYKKLKPGDGDFVECEHGDLEFHNNAEVHESIFTEHNTEHYIQVITKQYTRKPPLADFKEAAVLAASDFVQPLVKKLKIHHFSHHKDAALSLEGDNLCFTFKFVLHLHRSANNHEAVVSQKEVSSCSIQVHKVPLSLPTDFVDSSDSSENSDCKEFKETASVHLFTHFGEFVFEDVEVCHKEVHISCRRQQVANLTVAEVIELSFLGALLEKHPKSSSSHSISKRCKVVQKFLEVIVEVVPIESAFSCIANMSSDHNARHFCHMLKLANVRPPLSLAFFINAALAITKLQGEVVNFYDIATLEDLFYVFFVAARRRAAPLIWSSTQTVDEAKYLKWFGRDLSYHGRNGDMITYLQTIVEDAISQSSKSIPAISGVSIKSLFEATEAVSTEEGDPVRATVKSPGCLLKEGKHKLQQLQDRAQGALKSHPRDMNSIAKANNAMLLTYVNKLRSEELHICIQAITAFMEEQVRIPVKDFSLKVSYWQLLKLGLGIFRRKVANDFVAQYISVSKHIQTIADGTSRTVNPYEGGSSSNSKYAGKLQFLLRASLHQDESLIFDNNFLMYSLENNLYTRFAHSTVPEDRRITESTPLEDIVRKWDTLFKDVVMSNVTHSHRHLIARWLKFSLLIHKLRAELYHHTTVGVVGLVNSGKSTLVKELFRIEVVETGTIAEKRTTVPFLYSIPGVDNFDVIDFPGADDQDDHISDLVNLLRTLSQLVVFVVDYRNAHTKEAVEWYRKLNQYAIPHLICLTYGDRLYAECGRHEQDSAHIKKAIKKQVEIIHKKIKSQVPDTPLRCLGLYSLTLDKDSLLKSEKGQRNIRDAGIKGVKDVGQWIVTSLEEHLKEIATAGKLKDYLNLT